MINIKGIDKAELLLELYNHAYKKGLGLGLGNGQSQLEDDFTIEKARELLKTKTRFEYINERIMKVDLSNDDSFDELYYDMHNGFATAKKIVDEIRAKHSDVEQSKNTFEATIIDRHDAFLKDNETEQSENTSEAIIINKPDAFSKKSDINKSADSSDEINYDILLNLLKSEYSVIDAKNKKYLVDGEGKIVGSYDESSIYMYFDFEKDSDAIWNHEGHVVVTFSKDFQVNSAVCDVLMVDGLCGACNDAVVHNHFAYETTASRELYYLANNEQQNQMNMYLERKHGIKKVKLYHKLDSAMPNKHNKIMVEKDGMPVLGSCGTIESTKNYFYRKNDGLIKSIEYEQISLVDIDICGKKLVKDVKVNTVSEPNFIVNVLSVNNINPSFNFNQVINYYLDDTSYNMYYHSKYDDRYREWINRRSFSTVDTDDINLLGDSKKYASLFNESTIMNYNQQPEFDAVGHSFY